MNDQQQATEPTVNGVPVKDLPGYAQKLFEKVVNLRQKEATLQGQLIQARGALEEIANMLAEEVEAFKASNPQLEIPSQPVS